ncbi:hypothetical protein J1770_gp81 [Gordonia phage EMoore]|uniref:DNA binding protein n=1 Tax=Gordonia phage EMoore TaxID=2656534 RepID=A0A649VTR7_9CAUD|nr:hypothetical protein J1770_gp81 [Gordonia phage EMoore]QGJ95866.1 hypothetical protein SEA_EMOORE_81 [Gordonia phage EMoore]
MARQKMLDLVEFAALAGVKYATMRKYHQRASRRRREVASGDAKKVAEWMLPEPDGRIGQMPWWYESTARKWIEARQNRAPAENAS